MNTEVTSLLRLNDWAGRIVLLFYGIGTTILALLNLDGLTVPAFGIACLVLVWVGLGILGRADEEPFRLRSSLAVIAIVSIGTVFSSWNIVNLAKPGYATWYLGALTFLLLVLALRGRRRLAWMGFVVLLALSLAIAVVVNQDVVMVFNYVIRQAATLLIGTLFALVLRRSGQTITAIQSAQLSRATFAAATAASTRERAVQNARLERDARPALQRILDSEPLDPDELQHFALLETMLRDGIRATGFSSDDLAEATRRARERGLTVTLLDDRGSELTEEERELVERAFLDQLESTAEGSITARLSPNDRDELATIVVEEGGEYRRVVVTHDAVKVTHL